MSTLIPPAIESRLDAGRKASNLAFALRVLPADRRRDALVFYRFCRTLDDISDSPDLSDKERTIALDAWDQALRERGAAPADLEAVVARNGIDRSLLQEILAGVRADLSVHRYANFEEVRKYCWRVASAVGLASIRIFGATRPESETYAESLGLALQWTNILRDVAEDAVNDRIYLPLDELARFEITPEEILRGQPPENFSKFMAFQAQRAAAFFEQARRSLHPAERHALAPAEVMRHIYMRLLAKMERDGFRVIAKRYRVSRTGKLFIAARTLLLLNFAARGGESPARAKAD